MARGREEEQPARIAGEDDIPEDDEAPVAEEEQRTVVRYVTYGVGEDDDARWGWEGLDVTGQVVARSEPEFESEKDVAKAIKEQQEA